VDFEEEIDNVFEPYAIPYNRLILLLIPSEMSEEIRIQKKFRIKCRLRKNFFASFSS